jgi:hypothetical protein
LADVEGEEGGGVGVSEDGGVAAWKGVREGARLRRWQGKEGGDEMGEDREKGKI